MFFCHHGIIINEQASLGVSADPSLRNFSQRRIIERSKGLVGPQGRARWPPCANNAQFTGQNFDSTFLFSVYNSQGRGLTIAYLNIKRRKDK